MSDTFEPPVRPAKLFYLTEPSRGTFIVNVQVEHTLGCIEITKNQLANFLVDGSAMALRRETGRG